jgi:hypothetical protein
MGGLPFRAANAQQAAIDVHVLARDALHCESLLESSPSPKTVEFPKAPDGRDGLVGTIDQEP